MPSLIDDADFLAELDGMENGEPPPRRTRFAKPVRPVPEERVQPKTPGRIDMPFRPEAPARPQQPVHRERPVRPDHVDEIGETWRTGAPDTIAPPASRPRYVPASLAALTVMPCFAAGAGSAALVFHDRVAQIAVLWSK